MLNKAFGGLRVLYTNLLVEVAEMCGKCTGGAKKCFQLSNIPNDSSKSLTNAFFPWGKGAGEQWVSTRTTFAFEIQQVAKTRKMMSGHHKQSSCCCRASDCVVIERVGWPGSNAKMMYNKALPHVVNMDRVALMVDLEDGSLGAFSESTHNQDTVASPENHRPEL
jgi:hypothetical protein